MDHNTDWSSSYQPLPQASSLFLKVLILRPFRTSALALFSLAIAPRMRHRSIAYMCSKVSIVCFEEIAGELRTIVSDDAIRDPEPAHEALDELDCRTNWDGADGFHLHPLGELVDGDVEVKVAPRRSRERPKMSSPQTANGHVRGMVWRP